jgi:hypothetical protein
MRLGDHLLRVIDESGVAGNMLACDVQQGFHVVGKCSLVRCGAQEVWVPKPDGLRVDSLQSNSNLLQCNSNITAIEFQQFHNYSRKPWFQRVKSQSHTDSGRLMRLSRGVRAWPT